MPDFEFVTPLAPRGDQPQAIEKLTRGLEEGRKYQTLLGVTGSGKTFTIANVIARLNRPVLVVSHNKTLAAQLYSEFRDLFPHNAVEYFVSYYDYYQPEAYIPQSDLYIEKDASINEDLDRLRLAATTSLMWRRDVVVVASVSCLYGLGSPENFREMCVRLARGEGIDREEVLRRLVAIQYRRNDVEFARGHFRVRGDVVDVFPACGHTAFRVETFGSQVEALREIDPVTGEILREHDEVFVYPAKHFVMPDGAVAVAFGSIEAELAKRLAEFRRQGKLLEAQRLESRTRYDMELLDQIGYCPGVENYSRHLAGRAPGERPWTLFDYFPKDLLVVVDESHVTLPQVRAMHRGDRARKLVLVEHGFRLPSALDNRPLRFDEFEALSPQMVCMSATPGAYEVERSGGRLVEQVLRPTGLLDPPVEVRPAEGQIGNLMEEVRRRAEAGERVLATTLTKRLAEDIARHMQEAGLRCKYLHSDLDAFERVEILRDLRLGEFDALVGVNLLREGLDLPEVSLVAILDADKEGFLRSQTSLTQTIGRTARNVNGQVILYAGRQTPAMRATMEEVERRRSRQLAYNQEHGIEPETIRKAVRAGIAEILRAREVEDGAAFATKDVAEREEEIRLLEAEMFRLADELRFEEAAEVRDRLAVLRSAASGRASPAAAVATASRKKKQAKARRRRAIRKWKR